MKKVALRATWLQPPLLTILILLKLFGTGWGGELPKGSGGGGQKLYRCHVFFFVCTLTQSGRSKSEPHRSRVFWFQAVTALSVYPLTLKTPLSGRLSDLGKVLPRRSLESGAPKLELGFPVKPHSWTVEPSAYLLYRKRLDSCASEGTLLCYCGIFYMASSSPAPELVLQLLMILEWTFTE